MAETSITTLWPWKVRELAEKEPQNGVFRLLRNDVTRFLTTILIGATYFPSHICWYFVFPFFRHEAEHFFLIVEFTCVLSVVNIGATALVTEAATAIFSEAGVSAATGVMTVCLIFPA
ncbi:hypothetical protein ABKV19_004614 [Rosa sericea]